MTTRETLRRGLVLDDDPALGSLLARHLEELGYTMTRCASCMQARQVLSRQSFELVFIDYHLPDGIGFEIAQTLLRGSPRPKTFLMSGAGEALPERWAREMKADGYLRKPLSLDKIDALLERSSQPP